METGARDPIVRLFGPLLGIFLGGGLLASTEALIVPRLQVDLNLGYARSLAVQLVYYAGYLLFAAPATWATLRFGAMRATAGALALMAAGCLLIARAQAALRYPALLGALLLVSSGATVLQIACNGLVATAGPRGAAAARFTLLQGFNSLGTVLGPLFAASAMLGARAPGIAEAPFLALAALFGVLAILMFRAHDLLTGEAGADALGARLRAVLGRRQVLVGAAAVFAYVGAEVTLASLAVSYLVGPGGVGLSPAAAGRLVSLYWGGAMVGRFVGATLLRRVAPASLLAAASGGAIALTALAMTAPGAAGAAALLATGLCNSVMFPVIYGLAMPPDPRDAPIGSMLLCMAVVGGAVVPASTGVLADAWSLRAALALPGLCYVGVLAFALRVGAGGRRPRG